MENDKYVIAISEAINRKARKAVLYIGLSVAAATLAPLHFLLKIEFPEIRNATLSILLVLLGPAVLISLFVAFAEIKIKGVAKLANYFIILKLTKNVVHESSHIFKVFARTAISLGLYSYVVGVGLILTYGFTSGKDLISEMANKQRLPESIALFTLNGDGGNLPMLKLADYNSSKLIINSSSDIDMGLRLKMLTERECLTKAVSSIQNRKLPTIITTVEDSSIYSFLESENQATIFPLHAGSIEGNSIATRLFHMIMNYLNHSNTISSLRLVVVGNGKTIYYALSTFNKLMKMIIKPDEIKALFEKQILVVTDDAKLNPELINIKEDNEKSSNLHYWDLQLDTNDAYKTPLLFLNPASYYSMRQAFHYFKKEEENEPIVIMTTRNPHDAIRICQHLRQAVSDFNINSIGILASVSIEIEQEISSCRHLLLSTTT